jgi:integrase
MPAHTADMMVYGAMTMHRRANVTDLAWSMIDWEKRAVQIAGRLTKTGKPIYVPLYPVAMAILKRRYEAVDRDGKSTRHPVHVFTWRGKKIDGARDGCDGRLHPPQHRAAAANRGHPRNEVERGSRASAR